jgi:hypothetical protein
MSRRTRFSPVSLDRHFPTVYECGTKIGHLRAMSLSLPAALHFLRNPHVDPTPWVHIHANQGFNGSAHRAPGILDMLAVWMLNEIGITFTIS